MIKNTVEHKITTDEIVITKPNIDDLLSLNARSYRFIVR